MNDRFEPLDNGEVVSVQHDTQVLSGHRTFRVGELNDAIKHYVQSAISGWSEEKNGWFTQQGIDCEALRFGSNAWQKGRIRLCLEFCPDEATSAAYSTASASNISQSIAAPTQLVGQTTPVEMQAGSPTMSVDVRHDATELPSIDRLITNTSVAPHNHTESAVAPIAGIAAIGTVATAAAVIANNTPTVADGDPTASPTTPSLVDTVLELDRHPAPDEIAFDFDNISDDPGRKTPSGMMELDLSDLGLDNISEHDFLNFEANGMTDPAQELANLQDLEAYTSSSDRSENSGMLIDEVWNEINNLPNWPGSN